MQSFIVQGFPIAVEHYLPRTFMGVSRFVRLNGKDIFAFLDEAAKSGVLKILSDTARQIWVCLSGNEGRTDADCRCTVCIETTGQQPPAFPQGTEVYILHAEESDWASISVVNHQTPDQMHNIGVCRLIEEIGYRFNMHVGFHLDNEHEWAKGKGMIFMMPVEPIAKA